MNNDVKETEKKGLEIMHNNENLPEQKRKNGLTILSVLLIILTGIINIIGYFKLPDKMATQVNMKGLSTKTFPTPIYLILSFALILFISNKIMKETQTEQRAKWIASDLIIFIANIVMIGLQI